MLAETTFTFKKIFQLQILVLLSTLLMTHPMLGQQWQSATNGGGTANDIGQTVVTDEDGNVFVAGNFSGTATFGDFTFESSGQQDFFLLKYNEEGVIVWAKSFGYHAQEMVEDMVLDSQGNIYLSGIFYEYSSFGTTLLLADGGYDMFLLKLNEMGEVSWVKRGGSFVDDDPTVFETELNRYPYADQVTGLAINQYDQIYVTGYFSQTASFDEFNLTSNGEKDIFLVKYNNAGNCMWAKNYGSAGDDMGESLTIDGNNHLILVGLLEETAEVGGMEVAVEGFSNLFVAKLNNSGNALWATTAASSNKMIGEAVTVDNNNNILLTGAFDGNAHFGVFDGSTYPAMLHADDAFTDRDIFIAKYTTDGILEWAKQAGGSYLFNSWDRGCDLVTDGSGNIFMTGYFGEVAYFDDYTLLSEGGKDIFVAKYSAEGLCVWAINAGGTGHDKGAAIAMNDQHELFLTGEFRFSAQAGGHTLEADGEADVFVGQVIEQAQPPILVTDSLALVDFFISTHGEENWLVKTNWLEGPVHTWHGVIVDEGRVQKLFFYNNSVSGELPGSLGNLTNLVRFSIENDPTINEVLTGSIPADLGNLTKLSRIDLSGNQLTGAIPAVLSELTHLRRLDLSDNALSGTLPDMTNWTHLTTIDFSRNNFTGAIPASIGHLEMVTHINLSDNALIGAVPESINNLPNIQRIYLDRNQLEDLPFLLPMPEPLEPSNATVFSIKSNKLTFEDLENNLDIAEGVYFLPQSKVGEVEERIINIGESVTLSAVVGGTANHYQWYKNGMSIDGAITSDYTINYFSPINTGVYSCKITNDIVTSLSLYTQPITLLEFVYQPVIATDSIALVELYQSTIGINWVRQDNWLEAGKPVSMWYGIEIEDGRVTTIDLQNAGLAGELPESIGSLEALHTLKLGNEIVPGIYMGGELPQSIGDLSNLQYCDISGHQLSGVVPTTIGNLNELSYLNLSNNDFSGPLPTTMALMSHLEELHLSRFSANAGAISGAITGLPEIVYLNLSNAGFTGAIPSSLSNLTHLEHLDLSFNDLASAIPNALASLSKLTHLNLASNDLAGEIPEALMNLEDLTYFNLAFNELSGTLPTTIGLLTNLEELNLKGNELSGALPATIGNLTALKKMYLDDNNFTGTLPVTIGLLENVREMTISRNQLTGNIPESIGNLENVEIIRLEENFMDGELPESFGNLLKLKELNLCHNVLSGEIPDIIGNLLKIEKLYLSKNKFTGALPATINNLYYLDKLHIEQNRLTGLPTIYALENLSAFIIHENAFTFEDIEPNYDIAVEVVYSPQDSVELPIVAAMYEGGSFVLEAHVGGTANQYQWTKNGVPIEGATEATLTIEDFSPEDVADYGYILTNSIAENLQLYRYPVEVQMDFEPVWPGDANRDGIAYVDDLLAIGLAYNGGGINRYTPSNEWEAQACPEWATVFDDVTHLGINHKHADCNGDGVINANDKTAILNNFVPPTGKGEGTALEGLPLYWEVSDTIINGLEYVFNINLGDEATIAEDIYGMSFKASFIVGSSDTIELNAPEVKYNDSWLGTEGIDMITIDTITTDGEHSWHIAVSRTDLAGQTGYGIVCRLGCIMDVGSLKTESDYAIPVTLSFSDVKIIQSDGSFLQGATYSKDIYVIASATDAININSQPPAAWSISPNPSAGRLFVNYTSQQVQQGTIRIFDIMGQEIYTQATLFTTGDNKLPINIQYLDAGVYILQVDNGQELLSKQLVLTE